MKGVVLPLVLAIAFYAESIFTDLLPPAAFGGPRVLEPHFLLVLLTLMGIYYFRNRTLVYAAVFGLVFDVYYTSLIGVYLFLFPIAVYVAAKMEKILQANILTAALIVIMNVSIVETLVYFLHFLISHGVQPYSEFLEFGLLPTLVLNLAFFIVVFLPFSRWMQRKKRTELDE